jgi:exopolyphosphatase / guanosine-5'-triphosphate,3'-diphosphate pyrophosphatase
VLLGVLDVGSNTTRLLVASVDRGQVVRLGQEKVRLSLGEEIERYGVVSDVHIAAAAKAVRKLSAVARKQGVESLDVFVTAPGRQSGNGRKLVAALTRAAGVPVRVLTTEEEGRLAYGGAVATAPMDLPATIAVCDVGGASTEIAVGEPGDVPGWLCSVDLGSVRLATRIDSVRFGDDELGDARAETGAAFAGVEPPRVEAALAVGGSARAARRLVGPTLGAAELAKALRIVQTSSSRTITRRYGVDRARVRILPTGLVILAEVQSRLGVPLHVCDGGIREGAVLAWVAEAAA